MNKNIMSVCHCDFSSDLLYIATTSIDRCLDNFKHMQFLIKLDVLLCIYFIIKQCTYKIIQLKMIVFFHLDDITSF